MHIPLVPFKMPCWHWSKCAKAMVNETAGILNWIRAVSLNDTGSHIFIITYLNQNAHTHIHMHVSFTSAPEAVKSIFIGSWPWVHVFLIFCMIKWKVHIKTCLRLLKNGGLREKYFSDRVELAIFFMGWLNISWTTKRQSMVMQIVVFGRHFLKNK